jgi:hypothetical protein
MIVILGSTSDIKKGAILKSFDRNLTQLFVIDVPSKVPPQPIGEIQTKEGAFNRAYNALCWGINNGVSFDIAVGIENGMWKKIDNVWVDAACICILPFGWVGTFESLCEDECQAGVKILWSDELTIPHLEVRPFSVGPNGEWSILKDPHIVLTEGRKSRSNFLEEPLAKYVAELFST